jgi:hypothetical protein
MANKIKLLSKGWMNLTGFFGVHQFVEGVSVDELTSREVEQIGAIVQIEVLNTDGSSEQGGAGTRELKSRNKSIEGKAVKATGKKKAEVKVPTDESLTWDFTAETLAELADQGISPLREFATPYGVKGTSIVGIIDGLLALKAKRGS